MEVDHYELKMGKDFLIHKEYKTLMNKINNIFLNWVMLKDNTNE